jgi:phosphate uptake regulator
MRRKINRVGQNTLTVSLPAKWVRKHGLKPGDELFLIEDGERLVVGHGEGVKWGRTEIDLSRFGFFHQNFLSNVYHLGYDEVKIHYQDEKEFRNIQKRLPNFIGYELVEQGENHCLIKDISKTSELEFDNVLRRTFLMLIDMSEKCSDAIGKKEFDRLNEIRLMEAMNNRFTDYCKRILNKSGYKEGKRTNVMYSLSCDLERVADEYKRICDFFFDRKKPASKELLVLFNKINKYLRVYYEMFYKYDPDKLRYVLGEGKNIVKKLEQFLGAGTKADAVLAHHLIFITIGIYDISYNYVEMHI